MKQLLSKFVLIVACCGAFFSLSPATANQSVGNIDDSVATEQVTLSLDGRLFAWDTKGNVLSGWPISLSLSQKIFILSPRLIDLDGDGRKEIVAVSRDANGGIALHVLNGLGQAMPGWGQTLNVGESNLNDTPVIADINGDGILEIAYATADGNLYIQKKTGESFTGFPQNVGAARLIVADMENDGKPELYSTAGSAIYRWGLNPDTGSLESNVFFQTPGDIEIIGEPAVGDINNDRQSEIVFSTSQNNIFVIDTLGRALRQIPVTAKLPLHSQVAIGDVNADGRADIVASLSDGTRVAFNGDGSAVRNWIGESGFRQYHEPAIGKIANNLYDGTFASATGWDFYTRYLSGLKTFAVIEMGANVHEFDRMAPLHFAQAAEISDVAVRPLVFSPNGDGLNDTAEIHYTLSQPAVVSIDLYDSHQQLLSNLIEPKSLGAGQNIEPWDGLNRQGTLTKNDDRLLSPGAYLLKITATTTEGLVSIATAQAVLFGINAAIEFPKDAIKTDDIYPEVWGTVALKGVAVDPAIGAGRSGFDFNSYKLYFRPGVWIPTAQEVEQAGISGSGWQTVPVPLRLQSPANLRNEPADSIYPQSNVSVGTVQHGVLGAWNTSALSNGIYTILLKVIDGDLNGAHRTSFDYVTVQVANAIAGNNGEGESGGDDGTEEGGGSGGTGQSSNQIGPVIQNVNPALAELTEAIRQVNIRYTLINKPSDINITVYRATGDGNVVYTQTFLNRAPEQTYLFGWNGLDNLKRQVANGTYRIRIEASAIDGLGFDRNESASLTININDALSSDLSVVNFSASMVSFNPLNFNAETPQRSAELTYVLSKPARVTLQILDNNGAVRKTLLNNILSQNSGDNPPVWDGTGDDHLVLPFGTYRCRLTAVGTEAGRPENVTQEIELNLEQADKDGNIVAAISKLVGDGKKNAANDQEKGILAHDDDANNDFPLEGNPDFEWEASGSGSIVPELEYRIIGEGEERYSYIATERREDFDLGLDIVTLEACEAQFSCFLDMLSLGVIQSFHFLDSSFFDTWGFTLLQGAPDYAINSRALDFPETRLLDSYSVNTNYASRPTNNPYYPNYSPSLGIGESIIRENCPDCEQLSVGLTNWSLSSPLSVGIFLIRHGIAYGERPWGPVDTGWVARSSLNFGINDLGGFPNGSIGTGAGDVVAITSQNFTYEVREKLNNQYRSVAIDSCDGGKKKLPFVEMWMGNNSGPDTTTCQSNSPSIFANLLQTNFTTSQDTVLADSGGKIRGSFAHFNEDNFKVLSDAIKIHDAYPIPENYPDLYTFSNAVRINRWDINLKYPNGDPVEAFEVVNKNLHGQSALDQDGNGLPDANDAVLDTFQIKMKPDVAPRRFVEIVGNVGTQNYQLKFYDAVTQRWQDIPKQLSAPKGDSTQTLAWWDVTKLNGENYTVLLRVEGEEGHVNEDVMNVSIGKKMVRGKTGVVKDAFGRATVNFASGSLVSATPETLVSVASVKTDDPSLPLLHLPDGTVPVGPVYNLKPDGTVFDPNHPVQMKLTYTCEEVWSAFGGDPAEITIYNLKENGELEKVSTINSPADSCTEPDPSKLFTVTAMLEHFSIYVPLKEAGSIPTFNVTSPVKNGSFASPLKISGQVSGPDLSSLKISYYPKDGNPLSTTLIYEDTARIFDFNWETSLPTGDYIFVFEATNVDGVSNFTELPIHFDTDPPLTKLLVDGAVVAENSQVYLTPESEISFVSEDGGSAAQIQYYMNAGSFADYSDPFSIGSSNFGKHQIFYRSVDLLGNEEVIRQATLVLRSIAPPPENSHVTTNLVVFGPSFQNGDQTWVSPTSRLVIGAVEGSAQLADIFYHLSENIFNVYENPISVSNLEEGNYAIVYYGEDIYQRSESSRNFSFIMDQSSPELGIALNGRHQNEADTYLIGPQTKITLSASDKGANPSGLKKIEYNFGDGVWKVFETPLSLPNLQNLTLNVRAIDNVDNISAIKTHHFQWDTIAPQIRIVSADTAFSPNQDGVKDIFSLQLEASDNFSEKIFVTFEVDGRPVLNAQEIAIGIVPLSWDGNIDSEILAEGNHSYKIYAEDEAGNRTASLNGQVAIDLTRPVVSVSESVLGANAGLNGAVLNYLLRDNFPSEGAGLELSILSASDQVLASVAETVAIPNAGVDVQKSIAWSSQNSSANFLPDGDYHFRLTATDASGNKSEPVYGSIGVDTSPPVTTLKLGGPVVQDAASGFWVGPSTNLVLEAFDIGLGLQGTYYKINDAAPVLYSVPVHLSQSGEYRFGYFSRDLAGNEEVIKTQSLKVDATAPQSEVNWDGINRLVSGKTHISGQSKIVLASQDAESGLDKIMLTLDGVGPSIYRGPLALGNYGDGWRTLKYYGLDKVGNREAEKQASFFLHGTPPQITMNVGEPKYRGNVTYVTSRTPVQVAAKSNNPSITHVEYQLGVAAAVTFTPASVSSFAVPEFTVPTEGSHVLAVRAGDDYENLAEKNLSVVVDNTSPQTKIRQGQEIPGDENFISPSTTFTLTANDAASGVNVTEYNIDGGTWQTYTKIFDLKGISDGEHRVFYRSRDNLDNVERAGEQIVSLLSVDIASAKSAAPRVLVWLVSDEDTFGISGVLTELFEAEPWHYDFVKTDLDFIKALRSGEYNLVVFATAQPAFRFKATQASNKIFRELNARVHNGLGVFVLADKGALTGIPWGQFVGSLKTPKKEREAGSFGAAWKQLGKGWFADFPVNPLLQVDALSGESRTTSRKELANLFESAVSPKEELSPSDAATMEIVVGTKDKEIDMGVKMSLPKEIALLKVLGGDRQGQNAEWVADMEPNKTRRLRYLVRMPFVQKEVAWKVDAEATWSNGLIYKTEIPVQISLGKSWEEVWEEIVIQLEAIKTPLASQLAEQFRPANSVSKAVSEEENLEAKIDLLLDTLQKLPLLGSEDETQVLQDSLGRAIELLGIQTVTTGKSLSGFSQVALDTNNNGIPDDEEGLSGDNKKVPDVSTGTDSPSASPADPVFNRFSGGGGGCSLSPHSDNRNDVWLVFCVSALLGLTRFCRRKYFISILVVGLLAPFSLKASDTNVSGFNVRHFRLTTDDSGLLSLYGSETLGHLRPVFRFETDVGGDLVKAGNAVNNTTVSLIGTLWTSELNAALGLSDFANIGLSLPVHFYENGVNANQSNFQTTSLGDMGLEGKFRFLDGQKHFIGGAGLVRLTLPTGERSKFTGEGTPTLELKSIADKHLQNWYLTANLGFKIIGTKAVTTIGTGVPWNVSDGNRLTFGMGAKYTLPKNPTWSVAAQMTGETVVSQGRELTTPVEFQIGLRKKLRSDLALEMGGGKGLTNAIGSPSYRVFAALSWDFNAPKKSKPSSLISADIHTVLFRFNDSVLTIKQTQMLEPIVDKLKAMHCEKILIEGHADLWGEEQYNDSLALNRAAAVKDFLIVRGINADCIQIKSFGIAKPLSFEKTVEGQPKNRRVEIRILTKEE